MKILALDPSSTHIGYCIAAGDEYVASGVFVPKGQADGRLAQIVDWALHKITIYEPEIVVLEEPAANNAHKNPKTDRLLARVGGAIEAVALLNGVQVERVWPSQVRASGVSKDGLWAALRITGKKKVGPDEADAIGVWQAWITKGGGRESE